MIARRYAMLARLTTRKLQARSGTIGRCRVDRDGASTAHHLKTRQFASAATGLVSRSQLGGHRSRVAIGRPDGVPSHPIGACSVSVEVF